jgi:hypothetical protein
MKVDMSPEAVTIRLKRVSQLRRLCLELGKMKPVAPTQTADGNSGDRDPGPPLRREAGSQKGTRH